MMSQPSLLSLNDFSIWRKEARTLTVSRLVEGHWLELGVFGEDAAVRAEPFEAIEVRMADWWDGSPPAESDD